MKIGIDISQVVYSGSGISSYIENLILELLRIDQIDKYILFGSVLRKQKALDNFTQKLKLNKNVNLKIFPFPPSIMSILWNKMHIAPIENFIGSLDIFHTSDWIEPPAKAKKVTTIHDLLIYKYPLYLNKHIVDNQKMKLKWVVKESRLIITDSYSSKEDIINYLKIDAKKIHVVYLGIDKSYFPRSEIEIKQIKKKYHLADKYILALGVNDERKNFKKVAQACKELNDKSIQLVGIKSFMDQSKTDDKNIKLLDYVIPEDLPILYSGARMFVYPSLYEGFGLPALEAMACATPVITSNRGSLKEIVEQKAIIVDPESSGDIKMGIRNILNMPESKLEDLKKNALDHIKKFSWTKTANDIINLYKQL